MANKVKVGLYDNQIEIEFYPDSHRYRYGGKWLTSVTSISGIVDKSRVLMAWVAKLASETGNPYAYKEKQKEALGVGGEAHKWIEEWIQQPDKDLPENEQVQNAVMSFLEWVKSHNIEFVESERLIYSMTHKYVGKLDAIIKVDGELKLIDFKTSKSIYEIETRLQTAGYQIAYEEEHPNTKIHSRIIINLEKETGNFNVKEYKAESFDSDKKAFLAALALKEFCKTCEN